MTFESLQDLRVRCKDTPITCSPRPVFERNLRSNPHYREVGNAAMPRRPDRENIHIISRMHPDHLSGAFIWHIR